MIAGTVTSRSASGITISEFLAPPSAWTRLPAAPSGGDHAGRRCLADEGDRVDARVVEDRVDGVAASVDQIEHAGRDLVDRVDQLEDQLRGSRVALGGLQDEGVAAGDRVGQEPERDHRREVERGDRGDHADGLADHLDVDAAGDALEVLALEQMGDSGGCLDRLDPAQDLAASVAERLAHVVGDEVGDLVLALPKASRSAITARARFCGGVARQAG